MIVINQETCVGCGACVKDCPGSAIHLDEGIAAAIRPCIQCGHCDCGLSGQCGVHPGI